MKNAKFMIGEIENFGLETKNLNKFTEELNGLKTLQIDKNIEFNSYENYAIVKIFDKKFIIGKDCKLPDFVSKNSVEEIFLDNNCNIEDKSYIYKEYKTKIDGPI